MASRRRTGEGLLICSCHHLLIRTDESNPMYIQSKNYATDISTCLGKAKAFNSIFSGNIGDHTTCEHTCVPINDNQ